MMLGDSSCNTAASLRKLLLLCLLLSSCSYLFVVAVFVVPFIFFCCCVCAVSHTVTVIITMVFSMVFFITGVVSLYCLAATGRGSCSHIIRAVMAELVRQLLITITGVDHLPAAGEGTAGGRARPCSEPALLHCVFCPASARLQLCCIDDSCLPGTTWGELTGALFALHEAPGSPTCLVI